MPISTPHRYREGWVVFQRKTKSCPQTLEVPKSEILTPGQCKGELLQVRSSTQQVPKVCAAFITTGPNDLFPSPPLPPHALHPPGNFRTILHILLPLKPYPRPYLTLPLFSPRRFPLALLQGPLPRSLSKEILLPRESLFLRAFLEPHSLSSLPPTLASHAEYTFCMALGPPALLFRQGGISSEHRSFLRTRDLQPHPGDSWEWHSNAVATCHVVLCVCPHRDSCQRGWRLLYIVAAYHSCSEVLQPYLVRFLQDVSRTPGLPFQGERPESGDPGPRACLHGQPAGEKTQGT